MAANLYKHTSEVLNELLLYFKCSKCNQNVDTPCTLGSCDDIFCCECALVLKNNICPICKLPAEAKDVHVDRQLFNMVHLCKRVQALLEENVAVPNDIDEDLLPSQQLLDDVNDDLVFLQKQHASNEVQKAEAFKQSEFSELKTELADNSPSPLPYNITTAEKNSEKKLSVYDFRSPSQSPSVKTNCSAYKRTKTGNKKKLEIEMHVDQTTMTQYFDNMDQDEIDDVNNDLNNFSGLKQSKIVDKESSNYKKMLRDKSMINPVLVTKTGIKQGREGNRTKVKEKEIIREKKMNRAQEKNKRGKKQNTPQSYKHSTTRLRESKCQNTPRGQKLFHSQTRSPHGSQMKRNAKGETPLHIAAIKGDDKSVEELLKSGTNPNVQDNAGWTALHEACNHGHSKVVELLLEKGALINIPGMDNDTPLHDAVNNYRLDCVKLLVSHGASKTARNIHGLTPVDCAKTDAMMKALDTALDLKSGSFSNLEITDTMEFQQACLLGTGLSRDQKISVQKCASLISAPLVEEFSPQVTHVVTSCNKQGMCPRTIKYLKAVLSGKWIVNMNWVDTCLEYKELVCPEAFEVPGTSTNPDSHAAYKGRMNRRQQLPGLFDGCQFYFHGSFEYPTPEKEDLVDLVKIGGGHVLSREPKPSTIDDYSQTVPYHAPPKSQLSDCGLFILHDNNVSYPAVRLSRLCSVPISWLMDCITTFSLASLPS